MIRLRGNRLNGVRKEPDLITIKLVNDVIGNGGAPPRQSGKKKRRTPVRHLPGHNGIGIG